VTIELEPHIESLYKVEPPLTPVEDGHGYWGVILRDTKQDKIQCHICGKWFKRLDSHIVPAHGLTAREYRVKFGLSMRLPLVSRSISKKFSDALLADPDRMLPKRGNLKGRKLTRKHRRRVRQNTKYSLNCAATLNKRNVCDQQLLRRYHIVAEYLGKESVTYEEMKREDPTALHAMIRRFGTFNKWKKTVGVEAGHKKYTDDSLTAAIRRKFKELGRLPTRQDFGKKRDKSYPSELCIMRRFGSWNRALVLALGLDEQKET